MPQMPCLILTRPQNDSARFAAQVRDAGWVGEIILAPLLEIVQHQITEDDLSVARTLVLTSQHAVSALTCATNRRDWPLWAVGPRTAQAARAAGFVTVHQSGGDAQALLADLAHARPQGPILHLRGRHAASDIAAELQAQGQNATALVCYEQVARSLSEQAQARLRQGGDVVLPVFSPRSGQLLSDALRDITTGSTRVHLIGISAAATKATVLRSVYSCHVAKRPDAGSVCAELMLLQQTLEPWPKPR